MAESRLNPVETIVRHGATGEIELEQAQGQSDQAGVVVEALGNVLKAGNLQRQQAESQLNLYTFSAVTGGLITEIRCR